MTDSPIDILSWTRGEARVVTFTTASKGAGTSVRIELSVANPWELSDIVRQLAELRTAGAKPVRKAAVRQEAAHA